MKHGRSRLVRRIVQIKATANAKSRLSLRRDDLRIEKGHGTKPRMRRPGGTPTLSIVVFLLDVLRPQHLGIAWIRHAVPFRLVPDVAVEEILVHPVRCCVTGLYGACLHSTRRA